MSRLILTDARPSTQFLAISQWHIAAQQPPSLKAIAPWEACGDLWRSVGLSGSDFLDTVPDAQSFYSEQFARGGVFEISNMDLINKLIIKGQKGTEDFCEMYKRHPLAHPYVRFQARAPCEEWRLMRPSACSGMTSDPT